MDVEKIKPYASAQTKTSQVEAMFDSIAPAYDFMNRAMTFGLCTRWRNKALSYIPWRDDLHLLDVATGTGDLPLSILGRFPVGKIDAVDLSAGMLRIAEDKRRRLPHALGERLAFHQDDSLHLPYPDASFDAVTVAYGVRNFEDLEAGLRELRRVLRPEGTLVILELAVPSNPLLRFGYKVYTKGLSALGRIVSGDARAYSYLPESIAACPQRADMLRLMRDAGFPRPAFRTFTLGVAAAYVSHGAPR